MPSTAEDGESPSIERDPNEEPITLLLGPFDNHGTTRALLGRRAVEVEHGIPGEQVLARISAGKRPRGRILEVLTPDPARVEAPCGYFRDWFCGGCQWQMLDYPAQLRYKIAETNEAMAAAGLPYMVERTHALEDPWRYRGTAGISLGKRAGFRRHGSLAIVPIRDCPISHPRIGELMAALNDAIDAGSIPDLRGRVRLEVRLSDEPSGLEVLIRPDYDRAPPAEHLDALVSALRPFSLVAGLALLRPTGSIAVLKGSLLAGVTIADRRIYLAAPSFFQTNTRLLPDLIARLLEEAGPVSGKRVADVYGGVGLFGLFMADAGAEVVVIESDTPAVEAGRRTAAEWGLSDIAFRPEDAEEGLSSDDRFDVVIVDPPRSGLSEPVIETLIASAPPLILYVSCLAHSLARDLAALTTAGYEVESLELFDFYPQTYHVELLAVLRVQ